jgi:hypothetical protein
MTIFLICEIRTSRLAKSILHFSLLRHHVLLDISSNGSECPDWEAALRPGKIPAHRPLFCRFKLRGAEPKISCEVRDPLLARLGVQQHHTMAKSKVKEPKVALKGEKKSKAPKASVTARAKPSQLSEEAVVESGSESESGTSGGGSDTESEAEKRQNTKKPNAKKVKATEPLDVPVPSDESSESSSDEEEKKKKSKKASKNSKKEAPKVNGVKRKSDESSSEESDEELPDAPETKKARTDSESSEEESEDEPQADKMDVDKPAPLPAGMVSSVVAKPFEAPVGYTSLDTSSRSALSNADLQGKQVWHITAPADLDISSLAEVALDSIKSGKPVLSHKGVDYVMSEDKGAQSGNATLVLLPEKDGYKPISQPVSKTFHLRQHVTIPNLSEKQTSGITGSTAAGDVATPAVYAVRPQPKGMRMRYRPPGFGSGNPGRIGSDSESDAEPVGKEAGLQFPKAPVATGTKKDRKEKKEKKDKKEKKSKSKD